jgi:hypothetical protein
MIYCCYMRGIELSNHAKAMLGERNIAEEWMWRTLDDPERVEIGMDNNTHYIKAIAEHEGRFLRVIVNHHVTPHRVVTLFFDRRLRRGK